MGIIKFLFITILILWVIRVLLRLVFPVVLKSVFGKMQEQQGRQNGQPQQSSKPEGSISIDYVPPQPKHGNADKLGDFVEYEEVK
ncbi:DUF4834 family protein [Pedobacter hartonius]|uniref:DUF4834 domain-containing protein n=1 Tax=Pedobacter hartonius TaxID=425514 RepID=A0A1H4FWD6_9SPHI|nr:DUF4834 family protein [Pedobacter hartonius]SEB01160.1 protein of unknown function [Pedobacter hartonius]